MKLMMKIIIAYLKKNLKNIILTVVFIVIFAVVIDLYNLPVEAVGYAALLCGFTGLVFSSIDFYIYYSRHKQLNEMKNRIINSIAELPVPHDLLERDYQSLIELVHNEKIRLSSEADNAASDMTDYYTLWVHQIKTPISALHLILQSEKNEANSEIALELFKVEQYVEMVLSYLRINSTSSDLIIKNYDLSEIVKQAVRKYSVLFIHRKIRLNLSEFQCKVLTDEKWLTFAIEQILSNSLKYTNKGTISIYTANDKALVIEDTGIGIAAEDLPRVFEKGFTGYNGRAERKSTGIGLYLCKKILTRLSHTIKIESEPGKGTKVILGFDTVNIMIE
jgi:signal transduction histidine kinase